MLKRYVEPGLSSSRWCYSSSSGYPLNYVLVFVVLTERFSYFHPVAGLYVSKLFAAYLLFCIVWAQSTKQKDAFQLQHHLRVFILYTIGLLLDEYLHLPRRLTTLWPYWLMLATTMHYGVHKEPIAHEALIWIDRASTSMVQYQDLYPRRGSPLDQAVTMVSLTSILFVRHPFTDANPSSRTFYLEHAMRWKASLQTAAYPLSSW